MIRLVCESDKRYKQVACVKLPETKCQGRLNYLKGHLKECWWFLRIYNPFSSILMRRLGKTVKYI